MIDLNRLTASQKKIINEMRVKEGVFTWSKNLTKFTFNGKTYPYNLGGQLAYQSKLIKRVDKKSGHYTLTELGRSIEL